MKATVDGCKTATDMIVKAKHDKADILEPSKPKFKTPGKASNRCNRKLFSSPAEPSLLPIQSLTDSGKFKLQLFPVDGETKSILEQNEHNPHLELTLGSNKKISSVVKHLAEKWRGSFNATTREIALFPYYATSHNLVGVHRWTSTDAHITAAHVYTLIGTPSVFRLRYGFFSNPKSAPNEKPPPQLEEVFRVKESIADTNFPPFPDPNGAKASTSLNEPLHNTVRAEQNNIASKAAAALPSWLDSISNMSFGALLTAASPPNVEGGEGGNPPSSSQNKNLQAFTCDSFDAAIGALIARQKPTNDHHMAPPKATNNPSIWDAEETCHAFSFHNSAPLPGAPSTTHPLGSKEVSDLQIGSSVKTYHADNAYNAERKDEMMPPKEETNPLANLDFSLPEAVEPSEKAVPCCRTPGGGADSVGFSGLLSTSLDAFQNFSVV